MDKQLHSLIEQLASKQVCDFYSFINLFIFKHILWLILLIWHVEEVYLWSPCHSCQAQAEGLVNDIHVKEIELERLNGLCRRIDTNTAEMNAARNRHNRTNSQKGPLYSDYIVDPYDKPPYNASGRVESLQRQMLMRSAFVLYILLLHILVFIKISF